MRRVWPKRNPDDLLFEGRRRNHPINYRCAWEELTTAIGRPDLHQHDLRHHRAAELLKSGTTLGVAAQVLGHSSLILQRRYGPGKCGTAGGDGGIMAMNSTTKRSGRSSSTPMPVPPEAGPWGCIPHLDARTRKAVERATQLLEKCRLPGGSDKQSRFGSGVPPIAPTSALSAKNSTRCGWIHSIG